MGYPSLTIEIMYILFSLTRFPLLSARVDELDFCFFFDAGTEIFVEDHVHFIFSNALSLAVSQGRRIRVLFFFSTQAQRFWSKIMYILFSLTRFPLLSARVDELDFCFFSTQAQRFLSKIIYILFSLTRFPLLSARVDELDFCFFFDAGTEILVEDHVHFIFSNGFSLVSKGRRIRFLSFLSTRAQKFLSKIGK